MTTIATIGMFDGVHRGHQHLLATLVKQARLRSMRPVVYTFDRHPQQVLRGDQAVRLLTTTEERLQRLRKLGNFEVEVLSFDRQLASLSACAFYDEVLSRRHPMGALVMGYDNSFGNKQHDDGPQLFERLRHDGVALIADVPVRYGDVTISSTQIRQALMSGDMARANAMLGYCYGLSGRVLPGRHIGHELGFPTANLDCEGTEKLLPADGVYAVTATAENTTWHAVANLGAQPTVGGTERVLEVHLLNGCPQLYGKQLQVDFVARLRDIRHFDSKEALVRQIQEDIQQCEKRF